MNYHISSTNSHIVLKYSLLLTKRRKKKKELDLKFIVEILLDTTAEKEINCSHLEIMVEGSTNNTDRPKAKYEILLS